MESYVECNTDFESFSYVTGDEESALTASAVHTHSSTDQDVYLNKLQAGTTGKYTFLHIGTSDGKLLKVSQIKLVAIPSKCTVIPQLTRYYWKISVSAHWNIRWTTSEGKSD